MLAIVLDTHLLFLQFRRLEIASSMRLALGKGQALDEWLNVWGNFEQAQRRIDTPANESRIKRRAYRNHGNRIHEEVTA